jgi:arginine deiminase
MPSAIHIESEIAQLERVLVHRPGREIARMTQHELEDLLFDDILSPGLAQREHDLMVEILHGSGAEVLDVQSLLHEALVNAPADARHELVDRCCQQVGLGGVAEVMRDWEPDRLTDALISGLRWIEIEGGPRSLARLRREAADEWALALPPVPNIMFMRDPCFAVGERVVVGRMATAARAREPLLVSFALVYGGTLPEDRLLFRDIDAHLHPTLRRLEGGDVLVLSESVLFIGCSERTSAQTIERLANEALFDALPKLERINVALMPAQRSVMHLDTILTHIDDHLFLGHAPLICAGDRALGVARLERGQPPHLIENATIEDVLREELGGEVEVVPCGGDDPLQQEREQWTDGANALCMSPGHILLYERNTHTVAALREHGFGETDMHLVQPPEQRKELIAEGRNRRRNVFSFAGSELSRARGGGRCLTMSLCRSR